MRFKVVITERRVLKSFEYLVGAKYLQICWEDQIIKENVVMHSAVHRGAYPIDETGNVDVSLDLSLSELLGEAGAEAQKNYQNILIVNAELRNQIDLLNAAVATEASLKSDLLAQIVELQRQLGELLALQVNPVQEVDNG